MSKGRRNDIVLMVPGTNRPSNFRLYEFENPEGIVVVHPALLTGLQVLRDLMCKELNRPCAIMITSGTRTEADLQRLASTLGWIDQGGKVARDSKHLVKHGGVAADIKVLDVRGASYISTREVEKYAKGLFDFILRYDTHVHVDQRYATQGR